MKQTVKQFVVVAVVATLLSACGGSGSDSPTDTEQSHLQFYNGSADSSVIKMRSKDGDKEYGAVRYGEATNATYVTAETTEVEMYQQTNGDVQVINSLSLSVQPGQKHMIFAKGEFDNVEFMHKVIEREEMDKHFRVMGLSLYPERNFDIYMSSGDEGFSAAHKLATLNDGELQEFNYWAGDDDSSNFDTGKYTLFLTEPGSQQVLFKSPEHNFQYSSEYVLVVRESHGSIKQQIEIDLVINASLVSNLKDVDGIAQVRLYNSLDEDQSLNLSLVGSNNSDNNTQLSLPANTISDFQQLPFGDYSFSAQIDGSSLANQLLTLNPGESKAVFVYRDKQGDLASTTFAESNRSQQVDKQLNVVSLLSDIESLDVYFVTSDKTIETTKYKLNNLAVADSRTITLPNGDYQIYAIKENDNGSKNILDSTDLLDISANEYFLVSVEQDATSPTGYKVQLLK